LQTILGPEIWQYFAFFPALVIKWPWTLITSIFLHADFNHLLFNMFALFFFGSYLERLLGSNRFLIIFIAAGIVGNLGYFVTAPNNMIPAIGASGAAYGLMGTLAILAPFMSVYVWGLLPVPMVVLTAVYALLDVSGLFISSGSNIAHGAHLAGLLVGLVFGLYLRPYFGYRRQRDIDL
jgi:membrane associated rhomboid family serine protease